MKMILDAVTVAELDNTQASFFLIQYWNFISEGLMWQEFTLKAKHLEL